MGRVETTDTGRVDQGDAAGEEWVGEPHLDELDTCPPLVAVALGDPAAGLVGGTPPTRSPASRRRTTAPGSLAWWTTVTAIVARSSSTGQTSLPMSALISALLPS